MSWDCSFSSNGDKGPSCVLNRDEGCWFEGLGPTQAVNVSLVIFQFTQFLAIAAFDLNVSERFQSNLRRRLDSIEIVEVL